MKKFKVQATDFFSVLETTPRSQAATMKLEPGQSTGGPENRHKNSDQWLFVIDGTAKIIVEGKEILLKKYDLLLIEAGQTHEVINNGTTALETLNFYAPPEY